MNWDKREGVSRADVIFPALKFGGEPGEDAAEFGMHLVFGNP